MGVRGLLGLLLVVGASCVETFPQPFTAAQLQRQWSGPALVAYLSQPDASPAVCDLRSRGPAAGASIFEDMRNALVEGLVGGRIPPAVWRGCIDRMVRTASPDSATLLLDRIVAAFGQALSDRRLDADPTLRARVEAMRQAYLNRPSDRAAHPAALAALTADLHLGIARGWFGVWAIPQATALLDSVDIERGWLHGRQVDGAVLDQLLAARDERLLVDMTQHLPTPRLRAEARRRVIRLHIQASSDPDLHSHAAAVEETVMTRGMNPISTDVNPPMRARLDLPIRQVRVRQQIVSGTASVIGSAERRPGVSVLPELPLRGGLEVDVEGLARPVTICAPAEALDPLPCLAGGDVSVASPLVTLDGDGVLHFVESLTAQQVGQLAREAERVVVPISIAGHRLVEFEWELAFEKPADLVLVGPSAGPNLLVRVERGPRGRLLERVHANGADYLAVIDAADAAGFQIVSSGANGDSGSAGSDGMDGFPGMSGSSATCPSSKGGDGGRGTDGSNGGAGGDGGRGGDGGSLQVEIACAGTPCSDLVALLRKTVRSVGGRGGTGGKGGRGGRGGRGGPGGSGTTCVSADGTTTTLFGGSDGASGLDGSAGRDGFDGSNGAPGVVSVRVVGDQR